MRNFRVKIISGLAITTIITMAIMCQSVSAEESAFDPDAYLASKQKPLPGKKGAGKFWEKDQIVTNFTRSPSEKQTKEIKELIKKAEQGDAFSQFKLGFEYTGGGGFIKDYKEAVRWWTKAAEQGYDSAQYNLGIMYATGDGVVKDSKEAVKWYRKAAEQGNARAQYNLGIKYDTGDGIIKDSKEAVKWYRKAGEQGNASAQYNLGNRYATGDGVPQDYKEAVKWSRKAADQGHATAQCNLGGAYRFGNGVAKDHKQAIKWYRNAAEQGVVEAQFQLGYIYHIGDGVTKDFKETVKWYRKAAEQGHAMAQGNFSIMYYNGEGVIEDYAEAYKWLLLAGMNGLDVAEFKSNLKRQMTGYQIAEAQKLAREFKPKTGQGGNDGIEQAGNDSIKSTGTGFIVSSNGYVITAQHVIKDARQIKVVTERGLVDARLEKSSSTDDIAILKIEGSNYPAVPVISSRRAKLGTDVFTIGFPNTGLQGFEPKFTKGNISSLSGIQDNPRFFQISVPVQPGNSGGALFDDKGNVVGVIVSKLNAAVTYELTGSLPQNVNYAVKSSFLLASLEAIPEITEKMKEAYTGETDQIKVIEQAKKSVVLVLTY